jgi:hypothetical protein
MQSSIAVTLLLGLAMAPAAMAEHHLEGKWEGTAETPRGAQEITFDFMEADGHLTGTISTRRGESEIEEGTVDGNEIAFKQTLSFQGREVVLSYSGTVDGDEITFTREVEGRGRSSEFTAKRVE